MRYATGSMRLEHDKALQNGRQLADRVVKMHRVGVAFLAVGGHGEDGGIGDARLDVGEDRVF